MSDLQLPAMGVGSYAAPGWFIAMQRLLKPEDLGEIDARELIEDATRVVVEDQIEAGLNVISDGELGRQRFVFEVLGRLSNLTRVPPPRRLGIAGYDKAPSFVSVGPIAAERGLGTVAEFERTRAIAPDHWIKIALPGPLTFASYIATGERSRDVVLEELVSIVRGELVALAQAGCSYLQLDEPGLAHLPYAMTFEDGARVINRAIEGVPGRIAVHVCYGNNAGRPMADRRLRPMMGALMSLSCDQLLLEFAAKQMSDVELLGELASKFDIAAGVIDVKNFYLETPEDVAQRIDACLQHAPIERLGVTCDCGFSALPRYLARQKMQAMVAGAKLVRGRA
ncbi:MAG TPA: cobalamin-independent methionine synthase II family protein [Alphaproteobacteria bacterium]|nr:cobalamin-independent methionine synthase II family protein [Alphaproteobacteria bacterium]